MGKSWLFGLLTLTIVVGLIGLLAFTSESVHRVFEPARPLPDVAPAPPVEPEMGPMFYGNGLTLTY